MRVVNTMEILVRNKLNMVSYKYSLAKLMLFIKIEIEVKISNESTRTKILINESILAVSLAFFAETSTSSDSGIIMDLNEKSFINLLAARSSSNRVIKEM